MELNQSILNIVTQIKLNLKWRQTSCGGSEIISNVLEIFEVLRKIEPEKKSWILPRRKTWLISIKNYV